MEADDNNNNLNKISNDYINKIEENNNNNNYNNNNIGVNIDPEIKQEIELKDFYLEEEKENMNYDEFNTKINSVKFFDSKKNKNPINNNITNFNNDIIIRAQIEEDEKGYSTIENRQNINTLEVINK